MLTTAEALATVLHFTYIYSSLFTLHGLAFGSSVACGWYASATTFLCQVWNGYRGCGTYARTTALGSERAGGGVQESIFAGGRGYARCDRGRLRHGRLFGFIDDGHGGRCGQQRRGLSPRHLGGLINGILIRFFVSLFVDCARVKGSFKGSRSLWERFLFVLGVVFLSIFAPADGGAAGCL